MSRGVLLHMPQVSASTAIRKSESLQEELSAAVQRAAHEACRTDGERQAVAERHVAHLTAMQQVGGTQTHPGRGSAYITACSLLPYSILLPPPQSRNN